MTWPENPRAVAGGPQDGVSPGPGQRARIPTATYRLQFSHAFTFRDALALVPYLYDLGISDIYASPLLQARPGSEHGYDICDPTRLNSELGSPEDFAALVAALQDRGMGLILDMVPNHMGINETCNAWWQDVLENGPSSPYAGFFDIDWHPAKPEFQNRVLLPILEAQYGAALESGKLQLAIEEGALWLYHYDMKLPIAPGTYRLVLEHCVAKLSAAAADEPGEAAEPTSAAARAAQAANIPTGGPVLELQSILTAVSHLPSRLETDALRVAERYREKEVIKRRLAVLYNDNAVARECLDATLAERNGHPGDPHSFDLLDGLLDAQVYRVAFWRVAGEEINYRRFFDINDLAAIRVEVPEAFQATHQFVLRLLREGQVTGLRIDHPDGLWDPTTYFRQLQESYVDAVAAEPRPATGTDPGPEAAASLRNEELPLYVVAEKILSEREPLPQDWAVHGTTGYDFLALVNNLFVHRGNAQVFSRLYSLFINDELIFDDLTIQTKMLIMRDSLASEINALSHQLERIGERNRHYRDFTLNGITAALREVIACLPVYRTYINAITGDVPERDRKFVELASRMARRRRPGLADAIFEFVRDTLLLRNLQDFAEADRADLANFVMKFQQLTGPVMGKGVEDTAFYIYNRLVSLNEVGSSPDQFGIGVPEFHRANARRAEHWPHAMLATSTHDNKRSEDVRARIDVLSEIPEMWRAALARWSRLNNAKKTMLDGNLAPDRNDEYLLYQTLVGAWPPAVEAEPEISGGAGHDQERGQAEALNPAGSRNAPNSVPAVKREGHESATQAAPERVPQSREIDVPDMAAAANLDLEFFDVAAHTGSRSDGGSGQPQGGHWSFLLVPSTEPAYNQFRDRICTYMQKAAKEAKVHTGWVNPDADYDQALQSFVDRLLTPDSSNLFPNQLAFLARRVAYYGQFNSLAQVLLKLTAPGVPDIYQGNELWDFSLVDPDNRRPVDHDRRRMLLTGLQEQLRPIDAGDAGEAVLLLDLIDDLLQHSPDGRVKLYLTWRTLTYRRSRSELYREGTYVPLAAQGSKSDYVCAFARRLGQLEALTVVPCLVVGLTNDIERPPMGTDVWGGTWLTLPGMAPETAYRNILTGEILQVTQHGGQPGLPLATILGHFPVALLERVA